MTQDHTEREVTPNARYDAVFGTSYQLHEQADAEARRELEKGNERERQIARRIEREAETCAGEAEDGEELTWDHISVAEDPELLASICSYFRGVNAGEEVEEIRRKLRTGDVEWYANTFVVARGIIKPDGTGWG